MQTVRIILRKSSTQFRYRFKSNQKSQCVSLSQGLMHASAKAAHVSLQSNWLEAGLSTFRSKQSQGFFVTIKSVKISYTSNL